MHCGDQIRVYLQHVHIFVFFCKSQKVIHFIKGYMHDLYNIIYMDVTVVHDILCKIAVFV